MTWGLVVVGVVEVVVGVVEVVVVVVAGVVVASFCGSKKLKLNDAIVIGVGVVCTGLVDEVWRGILIKKIKKRPEVHTRPRYLVHVLEY